MQRVWCICRAIKSFDRNNPHFIRSITCLQLDFSSGCFLSDIYILTDCMLWLFWSSETGNGVCWQQHQTCLSACRIASFCPTQIIWKASFKELLIYDHSQKHRKTYFIIKFFIIIDNQKLISKATYGLSHIYGDIK